jgi:hypothetical protein
MVKHRGEVLEKYIRKGNFTLTKLAKSLGCSTRTLYRDFEDEDLPYEKLLEYSKALNYDFATEFPELQALQMSLHEPYVAYGTKPEPGVNEAEFYKKKYEEILVKYNNVLEQYNLLLQNRLSEWDLK